MLAWYWAACSDCCRAQPQSTAPVWASSSTAPGPGVTHLTMEEQHFVEHVLEHLWDLGWNQFLFPASRNMGEQPRELRSDAELSLLFRKGAFGEEKCCYAFPMPPASPGTPADHCLLCPWFGQREWGTVLQTKSRGDGEQLSPKVASKSCRYPPLCKVLWFLPLLASGNVFLYGNL